MRRWRSAGSWWAPELLRWKHVALRVEFVEFIELKVFQTRFDVLLGIRLFFGMDELFEVQRLVNLRGGEHQMACRIL